MVKCIISANFRTLRKMLHQPPFHVACSPLSQNSSSIDSVTIVAGEVFAGTAAPTAAPEPTMAPVAAPVGETVASLPEFVWELDTETGVLSGDLEFGVVTMNNFWGETTTRGYNGMVRAQLTFQIIFSSCRTRLCSADLVADACCLQQ